MPKGDLMTDHAKQLSEEFAKTWPGFVGPPSMITPGKTINPLADWQIAVACRFAEAYAKSLMDEIERLRGALKLELAKGRLEQFQRMKKERPIDPTYWDMHELAHLQSEAETAARELEQARKEKT